MGDFSERDPFQLTFVKKNFNLKIFFFLNQFIRSSRVRRGLALNYSSKI